MACYAPFNSMFFNTRGQVLACCFSHKISTAYTKNSIREIWFGEDFEKIRTHLKHNSLPDACSVCRTQIENGNYFSVESRTYDDFLPITDDYPTVMEFELENTCNLECKMCVGELSSLIRKNREQLPPLQNPYGPEFVKELEQFIPYLQKTSFIGGEPFLIKTYYAIWEKIIELNPQCRIAVTTNGTVLNSRIKDLLNRGKFEFVMSIDGLTKETYEKIRINGKFEKVMDNFEYFYQYTRERKSSFQVVPCPQKLNWHEMPLFIEFANKRNVLIYFSLAIRYPFDVCLWTLQPEELTHILEHYKKYRFPGKNRAEQHNKKMFDELVREVEMWRDEAVKREKRHAEESFEFDESLISIMENHLQKYLEGESELSENQKVNSKEKILNKTLEMLKLVPVYFNYEHFIEKITGIPPGVIFPWIESASVGQYLSRSVHLLDTPYSGFS